MRKSLSPQGTPLPLRGAVFGLGVDDVQCCRADRLRPVEEPPRGPVLVLAVGGGHVLGERAVGPRHWPSSKTSTVVAQTLASSRWLTRAWGTE